MARDLPVDLLLHKRRISGTRAAALLNLSVRPGPSGRTGDFDAPHAADSVRCIFLRT